MRRQATLYVLIGAPNNHAGTNDPCIPQAQAPTSLHFQNHLGQTRLNEAVVTIADVMSRDAGILLRVNDMSLPSGGLFDFHNDWSTLHLDHRIGLAVDIPFNGVRSGVCTAYNRKLLFDVIREATNEAPIVERDHFHAFMR